MKKILFVLVALVAGLAIADYTPVTREAPGGQNVNGQIKITSTDLTITNAQIITLGAYPVIVVNANGQASVTTTNTIAAASTSYVGAVYTIVSSSSSTNGVLIADSAPVYNSGVTLGANDSSTYLVVATNVIVQVNTINN